MKKVLIIGTVWPYHSWGSGQVHPIAKYLPEFGWEPIVLTQPLPDDVVLSYKWFAASRPAPFQSWMKLLHLRPNESVRSQINVKLGFTSKKSLKKKVVDFILKRMYEILCFPDIERAWRIEATKIGIRILNANSIDAIISVTPPISSHTIARELKKRKNIPWVSEWDHLFSQNNGYAYSRFRRLIDRKYELKIMHNADVMVTLSEPMAKKLGSLHKHKPIYAITMGFDPDTLNTPEAEVTNKFTITYTGSLALKYREPDMLFQALHELLQEGAITKDDVAVRFYGSKQAWVDGEIEKFGLIGIVSQEGTIPIETVFAKQRESQILFNPKWQDPLEPGIHSGKIFEYLAARRPILATGTYRDVVDDLLEETKAGVSVNTNEEIKTELIQAYKEYKTKGKVSWKGNDSVIKKYSWREISRQFGEILDSLTSHNR